MSVCQLLYESEINFSISCFWDGGFEVKLGDELNGIVAQTRVDKWDELERWLRSEALRQYPESQFARAMLAST